MMSLLSAGQAHQDKPCEQRVNITAAGVELGVLRLDRVDGYGSGNKYFKLKYNLQQAKAGGYRRLASFGGAFSNHIHALALIGHQQGFDTFGMIRGEPHGPLNPTLSDAVAAGMRLHYLTRQQYRRRYEPDFVRELASHFPDCYWIPEGGSNVAGIRGCMDMGEYIDPDCELIVLPCATAATLAGVAAACPDQQVLGISVLKGASDLEERASSGLKALLDAGYLARLPANWSIEHSYHCGGYARIDTGLTGFVRQFEHETGIPVEPIYSGKMFYAIYQMLSEGKLQGYSRITAIHTGGMQGVRGMQRHLEREGSPAPRYD